ncbi:hypothetical protein Tco_1554659 [Tanacetum coccineum]
MLPPTPSVKPNLSGRLGNEKSYRVIKATNEFEVDVDCVGHEVEGVPFSYGQDNTYTRMLKKWGKSSMSYGSISAGHFKVSENSKNRWIHGGFLEDVKKVDRLLGLSNGRSHRQIWKNSLEHKEGNERRALEILGVVSGVNGKDYDDYLDVCEAAEGPYHNNGSPTDEFQFGRGLKQGVIQILESLRSKFFNGHESSGKKASWVQWKKALAPKDTGSRLSGAMKDDEISGKELIHVWINIIKETSRGRLELYLTQVERVTKVINPVALLMSPIIIVWTLNNLVVITWLRQENMIDSRYFRKVSKTSDFDMFPNKVKTPSLGR